MRKISYEMLDKYLEMCSGYSEESKEHLIQSLNRNDAETSIGTDYSQMLQYFRMIPNAENSYRMFFNFLLKKYDLKTDILEVGCGVYPALSELIDEYQQKEKRGTITAYDPILATPKCGNIHLYKKAFDTSIDVSKYSLIIGLYSCEAALDIIKIANENDKDFSIVLCPCKQLQITDLKYFNFDLWNKYVIRKAKENLDSSRKIEVSKLTLKSMKKAPSTIIYSKKKK